MTDEISPLEYEDRSAECFANGHRPTLWKLSGLTVRTLCRHCGRTFPAHWLRLVSMPHVEPFEVAAA